MMGMMVSRSIVAEYKVTRDDILNYTIFDDAISMNAYGVDIHNPNGGGCESVSYTHLDVYKRQVSDCRQNAFGQHSRSVFLVFGSKSMYLINNKHFWVCLLYTSIMGHSLLKNRISSETEHKK